MSKTSNVNDAVHHIALSFQQTSTITGSSVVHYLTLYDGATAQCTILFRSDGAILLTSGIFSGTTLATYTGAFPVASTWYAFEFEVVIHNTAGTFTVRKNGNTIADFTATALDTQASANAYANKLTFGISAGLTQMVDDLFWQSGASAGAWLGDIRCYTRMAATDASVQFARSPATLTQTPFTFSANGSMVVPTTAAWYTPFTAAVDGAISTVTVSLNGGYTGNMKGALFAGTSTQPTTVLGSATAPINNPTTGVNTFTFSPPITVAKGAQCWFGFCTDTNTGSIVQAGSGSAARSSATTYASFPAALPSVSAAAPAIINATMAVTSNATLVNEAQQDGLTTYVQDATIGDTDFYGLAALGLSPVTVLATTTRGFMTKSDAGPAAALVQLKSGATTVQTPRQVPVTNVFQWAWRIDTVDPNTGSPWLQANIDNLQFGPQVVA
jgi:hypothetical protein